MADMTLEEALAAADVSTTPVNDILMIDPESRTIIVPASEMLFGVRQDMDAERKHFKCPKIVGDNIDLSQCHIYISYVPSKQDGTYDINDDVGGYWCEDLAVDGDYITFSWKLSGNVFVKAGYIAFAVYAKQEDADGNMQTKWHTTFAIGKVLDTLPDGEQIAEKYADVIEQLLNRMDEVEALATPEAMQGYMEAYLAKNPPSGMTAEEKEQLDKNTEDISSLSEEMEQLKQSGTGWTSTQITLLETIGNYLVFTDASTGQTLFDNLITSLRSGSSSSGSGGESGGSETPSGSYTITNSLINITTDNTAESVEANSSYTATLTPDSNYYIDSVMVTMGGINVTDTVYADGVITIAEVTGNVVIVASGAESDNLIVLSECTDGEAMPDGTKVTAGTLLVTPLIEVEPAVYYYNFIRTLPSGTKIYSQKIYAYNENQTYIDNSAYQVMDGTNGVTTVDLSGDKFSGVKYVRCMFSVEWTSPYFGKSGVIV